MAIVSRLAAACFVVALPVLLVTANVRVLAGDERFYRQGLRSYGAVEATGLTLAELDRAVSEIVAYFENDAARLSILVNEDGQEAALFNARETAHMKDVKSVMRVVFRSNEIALAVVLSYVAAACLWSGERSLRDLAKLSLLGVGLGFSVILAVGMLALSGFDAAWTQFHQIAFSNDLWRLNPDTDHLIQMFPQPFWEEATFIVAALTLSEVTLVVTVALGYLHFSGRGVRAFAKPGREGGKRETGEGKARRTGQAKP